MRPVYDVIILGLGPAGIQAAIHSSRKKAAVLMLGRLDKSSLSLARVENFFCCRPTVSGEAMLTTGLNQAKDFGAEILEEDALHIQREGRHFTVSTESGETLIARSLILATGTARNRLGVPGEKEFLGRGVSYCVDCDGGFFRGEEVAVVGGQSAAAGGALTLTKIASKVHLVTEHLDVAGALRQRLLDAGVILHQGVKVKSIEGKQAVTGLTLEGNEPLAATGVFIELGAKGVLELAATLGLTLDESMKYIEVDRKMATSVPGVFAAGDITGPPLQIAKAVGEGCVAGVEAASFARRLTQAQETPWTDAE